MAGKTKKKSRKKKARAVVPLELSPDLPVDERMMLLAEAGQLTAENADRHWCYEKSVQNAEVEVEFMDRVFLGEFGRVPELMQKYPNLHGDLSAGSGFNAISRDPAFGYRFLEEFQDRLFFGTDLLRPGQDLPQVVYLQDIAQQGHISQQAYEKIAWRNADRLLGLGLA